ncbi:hypothetical protein EAS64_33630 [Trebonia kvetii]|uniref:DUF7574 domain-containing protein n=1 Tax=Trebonia kvetii TaxID=2480626 RepID=A0A6P2BQA7_9ACTN|nr:hypothetical protein [Trebonia kvetii]TVZ01222.1 hypothetical protein EAS64_33630 [Trebonia kvetii]
MGWSTPDVYNQPEAFGLEIVATVEDEYASYSFTTFVILRDPATGEVFYASDSGCSCPSPFEDYTSRESLAVARSGQELHNALDEWVRDNTWNDDAEHRFPSAAEAHAKIADLRFAVQGQVVTDSGELTAGGNDLRAAIMAAARNSVVRAV